MFEKKTARQIPKTKDICASKKYNDILYAYLQCISEKDRTGRRIVEKSKIKFTQLALKFNLTRQTIATKFKNLKELGLVKDLNDNYYEIIELEQNVAALIPYETLKVLVDTLSERAISTYIYLFNRYFASGYQPFTFTLDQVKAYVGICSKTKSNDDTITNILYVLSKIGVIKYELTAVKVEDTFSNVKTIYKLNWLTTQLEGRGKNVKNFQVTC